MKVDKDVEQKIKRLQLYEQNMQNISIQKQQFQNQLIEIESALKEVEKVDSGYKIVGNIMVKSTKLELSDDLGQKKELLDLRIKTLDKQEDNIREKSKQLQTEVMGNIKDDEDNRQSK